MQERFWSKVAIRDGDACWEWQGWRNERGYGQFWVGRTEQRQHEAAHRVALRLVGRTVPRWAVVCHHCDNPPCCNPAHLYVGTSKENAQDRTVRERYAKYHPALGYKDYEEIRERLEAGQSVTRIAREMGLTLARVQRIVARTAEDPDMWLGYYEECCPRPYEDESAIRHALDLGVPSLVSRLGDVADRYEPVRKVGPLERQVHPARLAGANADRVGESEDGISLFRLLQHVEVRVRERAAATCRIFTEEERRAYEAELRAAGRCP